MAEESGLTRNGIQKALSEDAKPGYATIHSIIKAMGYDITVKKTEEVSSPV